jgi:hypothetical protein
MRQAVARESRRHRKEISDGTSASSGKHFPGGERDALGRRSIAGSGRSFLGTQVVFVDLIVYTAGRDAEKAGRL